MAVTRLPHGAGTASFFVGGFEAPTMRGITDRFLQFSAGVTVVRDMLQAVSVNPPGPAGPGTEVPWSPAIGFDEFTTWAVAFGSPSNNIGFRAAYNVRAFDIFQMIEEMSNGQSGALGRQLTLNLRSTAAGALPTTQALLAALETGDLNGVLNLRGTGVRNGAALTLSFRSNGVYQGQGVVLTRAQLIAEAQAGTTTLTFTGQQRANVSAATVQPTLFVKAAFERGGWRVPEQRPARSADPPRRRSHDGARRGRTAGRQGADRRRARRRHRDLRRGRRERLLQHERGPDRSAGSADDGGPLPAPGADADGLLSNELPIRR